MNSYTLSDTLAQVTENGIGLGRIFDKLKIDVDSYEEIIRDFSELDLGDLNFKLDDGKANWDAITKAIGGCDETALSYFKTLEDGNGTINNQSASVEGLGTHLKATGQSFNFAAIKATLLNTALNAGIFLVASLAIQGIVKVLDNYIHRVEKARERTSELFDEFKEMNNTLADHKKTVAELADRYDELSKGVNLSTNDNVSLSTEEYEEFLDINEQLANTFPELARGIDENGNSILTLGTKGITAKEQLEELLQTEEDLNNFRIAQELGDAFKGVYTYVEDANEATETLNNSLNSTNKQLGVLQDYIKNGVDLKQDNYLLFKGDITDEATTSYAYAMQSAAREFLDGLDIDRRMELYAKGLDITGLFTMNTDELTGAFDFYANLYNLEPDEISELEALISDNVEILKGALKDQFASQEQELQNKIQQGENAWRDFVPNLISGMKSKQTFKDLDSDLQDIAVQIVEGLDYSYATAMKEWNPNDPYAYIRDNIIVPMGNLSDKDKKTVKDSFTKLMTLDPEDISDSNRQKIDELITKIADILGKEVPELKVALGFDVGDDVKKRVQNSIRQIIDDHGITDRNRVNEVKELTDFTDKLTLSEAELWLEATQGAENATQAIEMYEDALADTQQQANETGVSLSISDTVDQLNTRLKPALDSLQSAYQDIFDDNGKFQLNSIDILSTCDKIKSKLDELNKIDGITVDYSAYEDFVRVLRNTESTEKDVNDATDALAASITQAALSGAEDFETMKAALEDLGVVNSKMVAFGALVSNTAALEEALTQANASMDDFIVNTEDGNVKATEAGQAFLEEKVGAENCAEALKILAFHKELCNLQEMNTAVEVANLKTLAENAGYTGEVIQYLTELEQIYQEVASGTLTKEQILAKTGRATLLKALIDSAASNINYAPDVDLSGATKAASKAGSSAGDAYVSAFEDELKDLQSHRDSGLIDEAEYLRRLRELYTQYFADRKEYLSEFRKYESQYLEGMKSLYDSALSGITKLMSNQIDGYSEAKEAAVSALEEERDARLEVIDVQKEQLEAEQDLIDKRIEQKQEIIDSIQKEIDAMKDARDERRRQLDLQKAQYELERMQNQRTILQYSEEEGLHYVTDTKGIREAKKKVDDAKFNIDVAKKEKEIKLIEDEIDLLEEQKEAIQVQIDALDKQAEQIENYYSNLISEQEKYFDSMIKNMEQQKSKWEELAEIQGIAEAYSAIEQVVGELGYSVEDILNGNEQVFEDFKSRYIAIMSDLNQNTSFQEGLEYASGVAKENFGSIVSDAQSAVQELSQTFSDGTFSQAITQGVSDGIVSAKQELDKMDQLGRDAGDGLMNGWDEKSNLFIEAAKQTAIDAVEAFAEGQDSHSPSEAYKAKAGDAIDGLLLGIEENKQSFIDTIRSLAEDGVLAFEEGFNFENSTLNTSFDGLKLLIESVTEALGLGTEGTVGGLLGALDQLSKFSFSEDSIIKQFNNLKNAIDDVVSAICGDGSSSGGERQESSSFTGSNESKGNNSNGGNSLTAAITNIGTTANDVIGEAEAEGDGTVIGEFGSLKTAVDNVTDAIGSGGEEKSSDDESEGNLIDSIDDLGETTDDTLGKSGGDGVIGRFEEFKDVIGEANEHVTGIATGLEAINGQEVECTIKVHIERDGSPDFIGSGSEAGSMKLESAEYTATYNRQSSYNPNQDNSVFGKLYKAWNTHYGNNNKEAEAIAKTLSHHLVMEYSQQMTREISQISNSNNIINNNKNLRQPVAVQIGDIHLTGVQDVNGLAQAIKTHLPGQMMHEYFKN